MTDYTEIIDLATDKIKDGKFQEALDLYNKILTNQPDEPILYECLSNIGFIYYNHEQYEEALPILAEAVLLPFTDYHGQLYKCIAVIYEHQKEFEIAAENFIEALSYLDKHTNEYYFTKFELSKLLIEIQDLDLSYIYLKEVEEYFKDINTEYYYAAIYLLGMNSFMKEEIELAQSYFNVLLLSKDIKNKELVQGYFGMVHISNYRKEAESIFKYASKILELEKDFYDKETLTYMTIKAYEYQNREQEFFAALKLFILDYPDGKYKDEYKLLHEKKFNTVN